MLCTERRGASGGRAESGDGGGEDIGCWLVFERKLEVTLSEVGIYDLQLDALKGSFVDVVVVERESERIVEFPILWIELESEEAPITRSITASIRVSCVSALTLQSARPTP